MPKSVLTPAIREEIARLERADIMVGIPSFKNATTIGYVVRAAQAGLVQYVPDLRPVVVNSDAGSPDGTGRVVVETEPPEYVERILLVRPTNKLSRVSLTYPEIDGIAVVCGRIQRDRFLACGALDEQGGPRGAVPSTRDAPALGGVPPRRCGRCGRIATGDRGTPLARGEEQGQGEGRDGAAMRLGGGQEAAERHAR